MGKISFSCKKIRVIMWAIIELRATGIPVGLGAPIYSKLDTDIAAALMSINAVKGVNIGSGMNAAFLSGEENSDEIRKSSGKIKFKLIMLEEFLEEFHRVKIL